jgi:hypothetical protein
MADNIVVSVETKAHRLMKEITARQHTDLHRMYYVDHIDDPRLELYFGLNHALVCDASALLTKTAALEIWRSKTSIGRAILGIKQS